MLHPARQRMGHGPRGLRSLQAPRGIHPTSPHLTLMARRTREPAWRRQLEGACHGVRTFWPVSRREYASPPSSASCREDAARRQRQRLHRRLPGLGARRAHDCLKPRPWRLARVAGLEEARDCARRARHDDNGPDLEKDVNKPPGGGERVLDLRGDRQQLHGRERTRRRRYGCPTAQRCTRMRRREPYRSHRSRQ